ncbi:hypothetical protein J4H92_08485 [Leucobacter weissii]|uniref:Uncharacterized protein n=1 Tax=Leucobacter weissii TaxID=1983706 RepID=A0A939MS33_9MICO|nr:hypothetical protein [Leucobacter weissii]MBO1901984.1 hypothetical protein [Leucobacter weissii]
MKKRKIATVAAATLLLMGFLSPVASASEQESEQDASHPPTSNGESVTIGTPPSELREFVVKGEGEVPDYRLEELSDAEQRDIRTIADRRGIAPEDYVKESVDSELFASAVDEVEELFGDTLSSSSWAQSPDLPSLSLTDAPSDGLIKILGDLPFNTALRYGAPLSDVELRGLKSAAIEAVVDELGSIDVITETSEDSAITVRFALGAAKRYTSAIDPEKLESKILNLTGYRDLPTTISFTPQPEGELVQSYATVRGGKLLSTLVGGSVDCTSGFSVKRNGVNGLVTADHCPNTLYLNGQSGVISFVTNATNDGASHYDLQFHRTLGSNDTHPRFRANVGDDIRTVVGSSNPEKDEEVCMYGAGTKDKGCSDVILVNECLNDAQMNKQYCGISAARHHISYFGDSGGPVFRNNTAKGIIKGAIFYKNGWRSTFTRIGLVGSRLDSTILKG